VIPERPEIFEYHDYRKFLADWLAFKKASQSSFSLRRLAKEAGLASGYLPMVLGGQRPLSHAAWGKLAPHMGLTPREKGFFENLLQLGTSDSHERRVEALNRMQRSPRYQKGNPREAEVYEYLTHWYYVAIREMAAVDDFQDDPHWIQQRLRYSVSLQEVAVALEFLLKNGYLERGAGGKIKAPEKSLDCSGGIYRVALGKYHRELLQLAAESIDKTPSAEREILCHTVTLGPKAMDEARRIANEAIQKITDLGKTVEDGEDVYHMEVALFPLTNRKRSSP
jgi:uncharacterized protein (TIGR02147 family)